MLKTHIVFFHPTPRPRFRETKVCSRFSLSPGWGWAECALVWEVRGSLVYLGHKTGLVWCGCDSSPPLPGLSCGVVTIVGAGRGRGLQGWVRTRLPWVTPWELVSQSQELPRQQR